MRSITRTYNAALKKFQSIENLQQMAQELNTEPQVLLFDYCHKTLNKKDAQITAKLVWKSLQQV